ncbi:hypothetical protein DFO73_110205 [Cytobacillus oceanisediminis]|uniref:Uncharacterized protein n=1 Tax=Cytobacillus oceanisediminis TaxID=665099 RepID=A0A2V2ZQL5_9BACI|nr:hypothetical protein [Cytobacillus oceanisediminis]PWW26631.1 hypothetical protein DFO73_110205 [Cytobacillus oceanisediminis]
MRKSFKDKAKEIIGVSGEGGISTISEVFLEGALGAVIPGASSIIFSYKQKRMEENLLLFIGELQGKVDILEHQYKKMSEDNKVMLKEFFAGLICDYVIDEQEKEKIKYIANGFISLTGNDQLEVDQTIIYLDILKSVRVIDLRILFDLNTGYLIYDQNFHEYLENLGIDSHQYRMIKEKLFRVGLLKSSFDDEYQKIVKKVNDLTDYALSLQKGKPQKLNSNFASFKPKERETISISKLGRGFIDYFSGERDLSYDR